MHAVILKGQAHDAWPRHSKGVRRRRLMQASGVRRSRSGVRDSKVIARLEEFAAACSQARARGPAAEPRDTTGLSIYV